MKMCENEYKSIVKKKKKTISKDLIISFKFDNKSIS